MALGTRAAPRAAPRRGRPRSCVWWFLFGTLLGGFGVGSYWMTVAPNQVPPPMAALPKTERPAPPQPSFQFPTILRDTEVEIRNDGKPPPPPAPRPEPPRPPTAEPLPGGDVKPKPAAAAAAQPGTYILQIGSFKSAKDAEQMKAQLALLGVSTRVQSVTLKGGDVWHRVVTGPMDNKKTLEETRAALREHGRDAMAIKVK